MILRELESKIKANRFDFEPTLFKAYASELANMHDVKEEEKLLQLELIEEVLSGIRDGFAGGTLDLSIKNKIFDLAKAYWNNERDDQARASILAIVTFLIPLPGTREWLMETAKIEEGAYKSFILSCANTKREDYII